MFNKVVVGYEDTPQGRDAFALAQLLAGIAEAPLEMCVVSARERRFLPGRRQSKTERVAERLFSQITPAPWSSGLAIEFCGLSGGSAAKELAAHAERGHAELIVLGSTHRGPMGQVVLGGVAERLLHGGPCAVAVAPRGFGDELSRSYFDQLRPRVLAVGFDGGTEAGMALKLAAELGLRCAATLRVITAINPTQATPAFAAPSGGQALVGRRDLQGQLSAAVATLPSQLRSLAICDRGAPSRVLLKRVDEGVDLLLMGSRGAGALGRVYLGSVATDVMHEAPCPVLITPRSAVEQRSVESRFEGASHV